MRVPQVSTISVMLFNIYITLLGEIGLGFRQKCYKYVEGIQLYFFLTGKLDTFVELYVKRREGDKGGPLKL